MNSAEYLQALKADRGTEFLDRMGLTFINASEGWSPAVIPTWDY